MRGTYAFKAKVWIYPGGNGAWHFITVPKAISAKIKKGHGAHARGWGSLKVRVRIDKTTFDTSIFPENKSATYLLPVKASVRKKESLFAHSAVTVHLAIQ